jgi:uncharacterized protein YecE (DUF72 family)
MSQDISSLASAISLPEGPAVVVLTIQEYRALCQDVHNLRSEFEAFREDLNLQIALDRKRIKALEVQEPQPMQKDRGEILRALLAANGGKMLAKDARHKMNVDKATFSRLLTKMKTCIEVKPLHTNRSQNLLILKSENG